MEKMLYFAKILAEEIREADDVLWDTVYRLLNPNDKLDIFTATTLRIRGNKYVFLENIYGCMQLEELLLEVKKSETADDEDDLDDYAAELFDGDEIEKVVGILFPNDYLYEILYDFAMLGDKFHDEEKDGAIKRLLKNIYRIAGAFNLNLDFQDGRIYITEDKKPLDDGTFICKTMEEVTARCLLMKGKDILSVREESGMSKEEFEDFMERLKQHEWNQTSTAEE